MAENLNISPDMINNLVNMLRNANSSNESFNAEQSIQEGYSVNSNQNSNNSSQTQQTAHSNNSSKSEQTNYNDNLNQSTQNKASSEASNFPQNIDLETILKMKSIMESLNNSNSQDSNLLYSLKPYLRKSKQAKLDQYINLLKITQVSKFFNSKP